MKKNILLLLGMLLTIFATAQQFVITGKVTGQATGKIKLYHIGMNGKNVIDSCVIKNGSFALRGNVPEPSMASLVGAIKSNDMADPNTTSFFLEPGTISISVRVNDFKHAIITGSKTQDEYAMLEKKKEPIYKEMEPLSKAYEQAGDELRKANKEKKDEATLDKLKEKAAAIHDQFDPYNERAAKEDYAFFAEHPQSYVTAFYLQFYVNGMTLDSLQQFYDNLGPVVQKGSAGREIEKQLLQLKSGWPGSVAKNFAAKDINGNDFSLASLKGKYVLVDFWASWCVPCRKSMPHVKELYARYKDKGFDVVAVSDDDSDTAAWRKAIAKDGTGNWHNVLRGLDWKKIRNGETNERDISDKFGIHSLPTKILIDKDGIIIGRYAKGTDEEAMELDKKIEEALGK